ncbi:MAG: hypothetical protein C4K58_03650 [Flavobacteriaceae bacterium]|nr:MAG: hypothetical protein C4K58_03650 [Flavobacteriaceae bacterium]
MNSYNTWFAKDSLVELAYFHPYSGKESFFDWRSDAMFFGEGTALISESVPGKKVKYTLSSKAQKDLGNIQLNFTSKSNQTVVKVNFEGPEKPFYKRFLNLFFAPSIESEIKSTLLVVKKKLEQESKVSGKTTQASTTLSLGQIKQQGISFEKYVGFKKSGTTDFSTIHQSYLSLEKDVKDYLLKDLKLKPADLGSSVLSYELFDTINKKATYRVGVSLKTQIPLPEGSQLELFVLPAYSSLATLHSGSYDSIGTTYQKIEAYAREKNLMVLPTTWEIFEKNNPNQVKVHMPIME